MRPLGVDLGAIDCAVCRVRSGSATFGVRRDGECSFEAWKLRRPQADQISENMIERSVACYPLDDAGLVDQEEFGLLLDRDVSPDPDEADHIAVSVLISDRDLGGAVPLRSDPFAMFDDRNPGPNEVLLAG